MYLTHVLYFVTTTIQQKSVRKLKSEKFALGRSFYLHRPRRTGPPRNVAREFRTHNSQGKTMSPNLDVDPGGERVSKLLCDSLCSQRKLHRNRRKMPYPRKRPRKQEDVENIDDGHVPTSTIRGPRTRTPDSTRLTFSYVGLPPVPLLFVRTGVTRGPLQTSSVEVEPGPLRRTGSASPHGQCSSWTSSY